MSSQSAASAGTESARQQRERLDAIRRRIAELRAAGESGIAVTEWYSDQVDDMVRDIAGRRLGEWDGGESAITVMAMGGNGRRRPATYSDLDVMIVTNSHPAAAEIAAAVVRDLWDAGFGVGHSTWARAEVARFAVEDIQFATSLIEMRFLAGSESISEYLQDQVLRRILTDQSDELIRRCIASRRDEWLARGNSVNQLEPDIKRSPGGLRDLHLLGWVSFLRYGDPRLSALLEAGDINPPERQALDTADEFLTALRLDLHGTTGLKQDVLTRELQLRVARARNVPQTDALRPVEVFMHEYFSQTSRVAEITRRVTDIGRKSTLITRLRDTLLPRRSAQGHLIRDGLLQIPDDELPDVCRTPLAVMDVFLAAARNQVHLAPPVRQAFSEAVARFPDEPEREVSKRFRDILRQTEGLPETLRCLYETGVLEWLIPPFAGIRCLIEFNQYHNFTVDEHTLKAIDNIVAFCHDDSPVGSAYQSVRHRATLHMAVLMHDIGKGVEGDHSEVGAEIAEQVAVRLQMAENKKQMLVFLVRHHLVMPNLAFRRDVSDSAILVDFARRVGSPELLRMLYVLTVADIQAVGPDIWSDWKGELLADLYNRAMQILSGRPYNHLERARLQVIRETVRGSIAPSGDEADHEAFSAWVDSQLDALPPFYLMTEQPDRIARDLAVIRDLDESDVRIDGAWDPETDTVTYRIFAPQQYNRGSFHKVAGILTGLRMNILAAQVCTTGASTVLGSFVVADNDFHGAVPQSRIDDVAFAMREVLMARKTVESVFRRSGLVRLNAKNTDIISVPPRVTFDNDCSERFTVIDVFATDRYGLLYTLARTLHDHHLSIQLARIATHIDQVVDVFYVVDEQQRKLEDSERLERLRAALLEGIRTLSG